LAKKRQQVDQPPICTNEQKTKTPTIDLKFTKTNRRTNQKPTTMTIGRASVRVKVEPKEIGGGDKKEHANKPQTPQA
jgi:hypothetical protein